MGDNEKALRFSLNFLNDALEILEKKNRGKTGGKKSRKQRGGTKDPLLQLLSQSNQEEAESTRGMLQANPELQRQFSIAVRPAESDTDINEQFAQHIKSVIEDIKNGQKPVLELTDEELQVLALFVHFKNMRPQIDTATGMVEDELSQAFNQLSITDSQELPTEQIHDKLITQEVELQQQLEQQPTALQQSALQPVQQLQLMKWIVYDSRQSAHDLLDLYENNQPVGFLRQLITSFKESFGKLALLLSILNRYRTELVDYAKNLKTRNPIVYTIISVLYMVLSYQIFFIYQLFRMLLTTRIGRIVMIYIFIDLYRQNNSAAVFVANILLDLLGTLDERIGASEYASMCMENIKTYLYDSLILFMQSAAFNSAMSGFLKSAFASPELMANFVNTLSPELTSQIVNQVLPELTYATAEAATAATASAASQALIASQSSAATQTVLRQITNVGAQLAISAVSSYFGAPAPTNLLTNGGKKRRQILFKHKTTKRRVKKSVYTKRRISRKTKKMNRRK